MRSLTELAVSLEAIARDTGDLDLLDMANEVRTHANKAKAKTKANPWDLLDEKPVKTRVNDPFGGVSRQTAQESPKAAFAAKDHLQKVAERKRSSKDLWWEKLQETPTYFNEDGQETPF